MLKLRSINWIRITAVLICLSGVSAYLLLAPPALAACQASECVYADECYSQGACRGGQRCGKNDDGESTWYDDNGCLLIIE